MKHAKLVIMSNKGRLERNASIHVGAQNSPYQVQHSQQSPTAGLALIAGLAFGSWLQAYCACIRCFRTVTLNPKPQKLDRKTPKATLTLSGANTSGEARTCRGPRQGTPQDR